MADLPPHCLPFTSAPPPLGSGKSTSSQNFLGSIWEYRYSRALTMALSTSSGVAAPRAAGAAAFNTPASAANDAASTTPTRKRDDGRWGRCAIRFIGLLRRFPPL